MIVAVGPPLDAVEQHMDLLCHLTGLVAYDLKTRLRPDAWGVVRTLADPKDAFALAHKLQENGLRAVVLDPAVAWDPARRTASVRALEIGTEMLVVGLREGTLRLPHGSLVSIVRGELRIGEATSWLGGSRGAAAYHVPTAGATELPGGREASTGGSFDAIAVADLHFADELCIARLDIKTFDFSSVGTDERNVESLDELVNRLAESAGVRVDRASRRSSLLSQVPAMPLPRVSAALVGPSSGLEGYPATTTPRPADSPTGSEAPSSSVRTSRRPPADPRFDGYSRLVGEAERLARALAVVSGG